MKALEAFREVKKELNSLALWLKEEKVLSDEDYSQLAGILSRDKIRLGVAGQMKYGKSTLINALLFKRKVLPTSDVPMTATLTFIEYGDKESYTVEFLSKEEWEEIQEIAKLRGEETKEQEICREIVQEAKSKLGTKIRSLLGKSVEVSKEKLQDYVGADGKFTPIAKALYIKLPHDILKELDLVDTPGFNDPIESREREAEKFLKDADALIFLLYAGRPIDATDKSLLTQKIAYHGTGGIILALNKYDIPLEEVGAIEKVDEHINKTLDDIKKDRSLGEAVREVISNTPYVKTSSLWALLGTMPDEEMTEDDKWYIEDHKKRYPFLRTKEDFLKYSGLKELEDELLKTVRERKLKILVSKFKTNLEGKVVERISQVSSQIMEKEAEENLLHKEEGEIKRKSEEFKSFIKETYPAIIEYGDVKLKIAEILENLERKCIREIKDVFDGLEHSFGDIGWFDMGGYKDKVRDITFNAYIEARERVNRYLEGVNDVDTEGEENTNADGLRGNMGVRGYIKEYTKRYIESKVDELLGYEIVRYYTEFSPRLEQDLKGTLASKLDTVYSVEAIDIGSPNIGGRFLFFGESSEGARKKAIAYKNKVSRQIQGRVSKAIQQFKRDIYDFIDNTVNKEIEKAVIYPIEEAIERAEENLKNKEVRLKELAQEITQLTEEKKRLDEIRKKVEAKIKKLGGNT